jgi:hypothetical protein
MMLLLSVCSHPIARFTYLWEEGWSPFQVVRSTGMWAPMIVAKVRALSSCAR